MMGLIPGKRVKVWMSGKNRTFVAEYVEVQPPTEGEATDVGVIRLLRGNELGAKLNGWVGLYNGRRGRKNVVTGINPWLPADRADIVTGDVILSVDGRSLEGIGPRATGIPAPRPRRYQDHHQGSKPRRLHPYGPDGTRRPLT